MKKLFIILIVIFFAGCTKGIKIQESFKSENYDFIGISNYVLFEYHKGMLVRKRHFREEEKPFRTDDFVNDYNGNWIQQIIDINGVSRYFIERNITYYD